MSDYENITPSDSSDDTQGYSGPDVIEPVIKKQKIVLNKKPRGAPKGNKNNKGKIKSTKKNITPAPVPLPSGGNNSAEPAEEKDTIIKLYPGFMLTLHPVDNIYYQDTVKQKKKLSECNEIIYNNPYDDFKIVRYDSNIEMKKNRRVLIDDPNIHGHTYYTFWTYKLPYNTIQSRIQKYFHEQLDMIGEYHITVGSHDHLKRNYQYITKDEDLHEPWSDTKDEIEYGKKYIDDQHNPKVSLYKNKDDEENYIKILNINSELDRYKSSSVIIQNIARHYNLVFDPKDDMLLQPETLLIYDINKIKEIIKNVRYMDRYQCLIPYIEKIITDHQKRNIYLNDLHINYI